MEYEIKNPKISLSLSLDTRANCKKVDGSFPVKYRISFQGNKRLYSTGFDLNPDDFDALSSTNKRKSDRITGIKNKLDFIRNEYLEVLNKYFSVKFSHTEFKAKLDEFNDKKNGSDKKSENVFEILENHYKELMENNQIGTASTYRTTLSALKKFTNRKTFQLSEITPDFLKSFENKLINKEEKSINTVSIHCKNIRKIFKDAIRNNIILNDLYPFGTGKYIIPETLNNKRALDISDILKIMTYKTEIEQERYAKDMFVFSYLCNGINMTDIFNLKFSDIDTYNNVITYIRKKTNTSVKRKTEKIVIPYSDDIKDIIDEILTKWKRKSNNQDDFIFDVIEKTQSAVIQKVKIKQRTKQINKYLKRIAEKLEIKEDISTYFARHSWATILLQSSNNIFLIKEGFGHKSITTTEKYISTLPLDSKKQSHTALLGGMKSSDFEK